MRKLAKYKMQDKLKEAVCLMKSGVPMICFDIETTGLSRVTDRILSFSAIRLVWNNGTIEGDKKLNVYINPGFRIPKEATKVNHITDEFIAQYPSENEVLPRIRRFIGENPLLCGYNCDTFDIPFLSRTYERVFGDVLDIQGSVDVMRIAKEVYDFNKYNLENVAHELGCDIGINFHSSMDDVIATCRVLKTALCEYDLNEKTEKDATHPVAPVHLSVRGCSLFRMSHKVNRIYFNTYPYTKTFYDIYKGEWKSDNDAVNLEEFRDDVFRYFNVTNEKELVRKWGGN